MLKLFVMLALAVGLARTAPAIQGCTWKFAAKGITTLDEWGVLYEALLRRSLKEGILSQTDLIAMYGGESALLIPEKNGGSSLKIRVHEALTQSTAGARTGGVERDDLEQRGRDVLVRVMSELTPGQESQRRARHVVKTFVLPEDPLSLVFSPDGRELLVGTGNVGLFACNVDAGKCREVSRTPDKPLHPSFDPRDLHRDVLGLTYSVDGNWVFSAYGTTVIRWKAPAFELEKSFVIGHRFWDIAVLPDLHTVIAPLCDNMLLVGDIDEPSSTWKFWPGAGKKAAVAVSGKFAFTVSGDLKGSLFRLDSGLVSIVPGKTKAAAFTRDGKSLLLVTSIPRGGGTIIDHFDLGTRVFQEPWEIPAIEGRAHVAILGDTDLVATADATRTGPIVLSDTKKRRVVAEIPAEPSPIQVLAASPDGRFLAAATRDKTVRLWDTHWFLTEPVKK